ncbi:bacteriohemerythrin [Campylobacter volucris]|uniref:bacteriohemerythrin n=1 Tax=Campylobacter volucris TaxID=1031542 RepID=UPI001059836F|nr:hemerythrin family protein [Campylobacter volucris]TDJ82039.1 bacteriohemerythrin [Campylobacter volucris]
MIKWSNEYSVDNETIDKQHKNLFEIAQKAYFMVDRHVSISDIKLVLIELFEYIKIHFKYEEEYMEAIGYPDLTQHKKIHKEITSSLIDLVKNIKTINDLKEKLNIIIEKWLVEHILTEDMKYHRYEEQNRSYQLEIDNTSKKDSNQHIIYVCDCKNHKIPYDVHLTICNGKKYICKICKKELVEL